MHPFTLQRRIYLSHCCNSTDYLLGLGLDTGSVNRRTFMVYDLHSTFSHNPHAIDLKGRATKNIRKIIQLTCARLTSPSSIRTYNPSNIPGRRLRAGVLSAVLICVMMIASSNFLFSLSTKTFRKLLVFLNISSIHSYLASFRSILSQAFQCVPLHGLKAHC